METTHLSITLQTSLLNQAEQLAQQLNISQSRLIELALEAFIRDQSKLEFVDRRINQGEVYWVTLEDVGGLESGIAHPHVVVQEDILNHSRLNTVVVCALTSNIKRVTLPGNVLLEAGEANLPRSSVVEVSKLSTVDKRDLGEYLGALNAPRVQQILAGMRFLQTSFFR